MRDERPVYHASVTDSRCAKDVALHGGVCHGSGSDVDSLMNSSLRVVGGKEIAKVWVKSLEQSFVKGTQRGRDVSSMSVRWRKERQR